MTKLLDVALWWKKFECAVIPVHYFSKRPMVRWEKYQDIMPTDTEYLSWFPSEMRNIALVVGNGLVVIDFDVLEVYEYWHQLYPLKTRMVKTRRGMHVYLITQEPAQNFHSPLLDVKAKGYVLIPPSMHPSGYQYQVFQDVDIMRIDKLEDVLPKEFTPEPERSDTYEIKPRVLESDPWAAADNAIALEQDVIQKIRERIPILSMLKGVESSSPDGRWYVALCPFHDDHSPSMWVDTVRGICGCHTCNIQPMDVINLYARLHGLFNLDAIAELQKQL